MAPPEGDEPKDLLFDPVEGLAAILLRALEERLKLPQAYIMRLEEEPSDWVFIVKLGLLVEATLTEYIVLGLGDPRLQEHMSNSENAQRLKLAVKLELISVEDKNLLMMLAEVRNQFVHRIVNLNRTLAQYLEELPEQRLKEIAAVLTSKETRDELRKSGASLREWLPEQFRKLVLTCVVGPLIMISRSHDSKERDRERAEWESLPHLERMTYQFKHPGNKALRAEELGIGESNDETQSDSGG